ncbi:MAG: HAD family hydrolase, partial [Pseudomonadota bacterium]
TFFDVSSGVDQVAATPLRPLFEDLVQMGCKLGVATNAREVSAHRLLDAEAIADLVTFVSGADSGFGAKPDPGQLLAFAKATGLAPGQIAMVGDTTHDLMAGRAAKTVCVGVLTGASPHDVLAPLADVVLPDISHLPAWLTSRET